MMDMIDWQEGNLNASMWCARTLIEWHLDTHNSCGDARHRSLKVGLLAALVA